MKQNFIKDMLIKKAAREEQQILDAVLEKLCDDGIIRAGQEIIKRVTETGFVCYTMPNYNGAKNKCINDKIMLELKEID
jgi:hypothetical protein